MVYVTTAASATNSVWVTWVVDSSTASTTTTTNSIWQTWVTTSGGTGDSIVWHDQNHQPTAEQKQAERERQEAAKKAEQERKIAAAKALELLHANLSQKQRAALDKNGWFLVEGGKSKKTYRIHGDRYAGNIHELDEKGSPVARYCVHADYSIPLGDQLLAQALSLRHDEDHIIGRANRIQVAA